MGPRAVLPSWRRVRISFSRLPSPATPNSDRPNVTGGNYRTAEAAPTAARNLGTRCAASGDAGATAVRKRGASTTPVRRRLAAIRFTGSLVLAADRGLSSSLPGRIPYRVRRSIKMPVSEPTCARRAAIRRRGFVQLVLGEESGLEEAQAQKEVRPQRSRDHPDCDRRPRSARLLWVPWPVKAWTGVYDAAKQATQFRATKPGYARGTTRGTWLALSLLPLTIPQRKGASDDPFFAARITAARRGQWTPAS
jgi:hypothetical protein